MNAERREYRRARHPFAENGRGNGNSFCFCRADHRDCKLPDRQEASRKPGPDYSRSVERAQTALKTAERFMWRFRMKHPDFDQMTALAERLRMELAELDPPQE